MPDMAKHRTCSTDAQLQKLARLAMLAVGIFLGVLAAFYWSRAELPTAGILAAIAAMHIITSELIWFCGSERDAARRASWAEQITEATRGLELPGPAPERPVLYATGGTIPAARLAEMPDPHWVLNEAFWLLPTEQDRLAVESWRQHAHGGRLVHIATKPAAGQ
ncbi:membrane protein [Mycobacterium phage Mendokysei]|uniref:Uncharacterized protein n=1 Tax=Mycobacterium phage Mendokysei TaxID=2099637 RepID=A0A2P1CGB8_9CAUD|nr:membrane protein [Mycobacterium phage Mendokysei]AVJ50282.1 hypothetical protein SEA_MENDOKYSEI_41 [Mycobacterium phage Mendokysei]